MRVIVAVMNNAYAVVKIKPEKKIRYVWELNLKKLTNTFSVINLLDPKG